MNVLLRRKRSGMMATLAVLAAATVGAAFPSSAGTAGSAGTDTSLTLTDSAVTVPGRPCAGAADGCGFQDLRVTVNQTRGLVNQAVSVTWTGAKPTIYRSGSLYGNFLQIFQCWGEDDETNPDNPGPSPERCQFGGYSSNLTQVSSLNVAVHWPLSRVVSTSAMSTYDPSNPSDGFLDAAQGFIWKPFRAVDGTVVNISANFAANNPYATGEGGLWRNPYFSFYTSNEIVVGRTHPDGSGSELFAAQTGLEAPGLGCGQKLEPVIGGQRKVPRCWLVVVPRATAVEENPPGDDNPVNPVITSPLAAASWRNRISVPLDFRPVDSSCAIGADERRIGGSELAVGALTSWQPRLCANPGSPPFSYTALSDDLARSQLVSGQQGAAGLAVMSRPVDPARLDEDDPVTYAPLALSGIVIGFNIERVPRTDPGTGLPTDPEEGALSGVRVASLNLTPRLVAKMLSLSYGTQFSNIPVSYPWLRANPRNLVTDPDFVRFNPEFAALSTASNLGKIVVEQPTGDAAYEVWRWVLADPEAKAWLGGGPDQWGMVVNPVYNVRADRNPSGVAFADPIPNSYPKSDPICYQSLEILPATNPPVPLRPLCMLDAAPYVNSMTAAAEAVRVADDGARTDKNGAATSADTAWVRGGPQLPGTRALMSVTDVASAARFGLQTARLSRAGDTGDNRTFVVADEAGLLAGQAAMVPSAVPDVAVGNPSAKQPGAYPLPMVVYGASRARSLDTAARTDYADFIAYAAGDGQTPGLDVGQLPRGYAPLPAQLRTQALAAAARIRAGDPAPPEPEEAAVVAPEATPAATPAPAQPAEPPAPAVEPPPAPAAPPPVPARRPTATASEPAPSVPPTPAAAPEPDPDHAARGTTPSDVAGLIRFAVPIVLGIGLASLLAVLILDDRWQRSVLARARPRVPVPKSA